MKRQGAVFLLSLLMLGGCGFSPLYGKLSPTTSVGSELSQVYVENIYGRYGQLLRLALQKDLSGSGPENPQKYTLRVNSSMGEEVLDIHRDNTAGRLRGNGTAHWQLFTVAQYPQLIAQGDANTLDGYNATYEQYFAQTLNDETLQARIADNLANQVMMQVATWFKSRAKPSQNNPDAAQEMPRYVDMDGMPKDNGQKTTVPVGIDGFPAASIGRLPTVTTTQSAQ
ncbi:LPS assembly lipoprotein LptE [Swingsia samuiensis]|uniref:LPS-assembly lipoprotein LptE n=1 Tax=Swingsia samuiensis TaxID=1293412 RepID=A0A4Y6UKG3_9PROT|nr:LPS assembly lipoprotein LptE [Swingsia samuiensis]QDH16505.1 hypothetical protein E3D00_02135 [Swingsia samuiensis]